MTALEILSADGTLVSATHIQRGGNRLVIASHGITAERTEGGLYNRFIDRLPTTYDAILFDFRGHGSSARKPIEVTISGEILDLMAILNWARSKDYSTIDYVATSFGASIGILAADAYGLNFLRKAVFWNPVISYRNTFINSTVEWAKVFFSQTDIYELAQRKSTKITDEDFFISSLMTQELLILHPENVSWPSAVPLFIIHGDKDTLVPVDDAINYARANGAKLKIFPDVDHGFDHLSQEAIDITVSWLTDDTPQ